ncbi:MAG TPA: flagellar basal body rod protein FlgC, partial [Terracidiphilus sp.]|nr:flagellar basal body rod protein FlgC [Terracidiphilus sp.]
MNLFGMMDASGEAMEAERMRAEVVAANMANAETTRTATGGPYKRQHVIFAASTGDGDFLDSMNTAATGSAPNALPLLPLPGSLPPLNPITTPGSAAVAPTVQIGGVVEDPGPPLRRYDPGHPDAGPDGYVAYPDINPLTEMVDLMGATRAYGLNGSAVQAEKEMIGSALEIAKS